MSRGEAYQRITLIDGSTGKRVDAPFLELDEELWSPDGTRFTLIFDPGRIKRGLRPREEVGRSWRRESRIPWLLIVVGPTPRKSAQSALRKAFRVGPPDESSPDPKGWRINAPPAGSRQPLIVRFPSRSTGPFWSVWFGSKTTGRT